MEKIHDKATAGKGTHIKDPMPMLYLIHHKQDNLQIELRLTGPNSNACADLEKGETFEFSPENSNFLYLHRKITENMPLTPPGKLKYPTDPPRKTFLDPRMIMILFIMSQFKMTLYITSHYITTTTVF